MGQDNSHEKLPNLGREEIRFQDLKEKENKEMLAEYEGEERVLEVKDVLTAGKYSSIFRE